ncbi:unnamed protein product [Clonostachys rhizophaga]|uniref:Uncharacterized protein n=1 Tax=Clonostachys rhizophaga TaxID=160324 RepID=A0A9N9W0Y5_9HYPO|nr:unnamed protein product [Clonostachys rhizophaga]
MQCEQLGFDSILAIGWVHKVGGRMFIKREGAEKLKSWPAPQDPTGVRSFLGDMNPTRRWIKNCAERARPLTRLTGDVPWNWGPAEALAFELLKERSSTAVEMSGYIFDLPVYLYSDVSGFGAGCVIIQFIDSTSHKGIYARWVTELRLLNIQILYIEGKRNAAADGLSRILFEGDTCQLDPAAESMGTINPFGNWV